MTNLVKKHMIGLFALVLTVATMSFKMVEKNESVDDLMWYVKVGSSWIEDGLSETPPGGCPLTSGDPCAKGFHPDNIPNSIDDNTAAIDERFRSPL